LKSCRAENFNTRPVPIITITSAFRRFCLCQTRRISNCVIRKELVTVERSDVTVRYGSAKSSLREPWNKGELVGTTYPAFFITVSTEDNRVGPGHARKLAARLEQVGAKAYYFEDSEGGHGVSDALQRPELMALRLTFLIDRLMN